MQQVIIAILAFVLVAYAFLALFAAFLAALAVGVLGGIAALAVKWLPYEPEITAHCFEMTDDYGLRARSTQQVPPFTAFVRATPIVIACFFVPLAAILTGHPPARGDVEAWIASGGGLVGAFIAAIVGSINLSSWVNGNGERTVLGETNDNLEIPALTLCQHRVNDEGKPLHFQRDYVADLLERLRTQPFRSDGQHWAEIESLVVELTGEATADLDAIRKVLASRDRLDAARSAARIRVSNSGNSSDHELWPALEKCRHEINQLGFRPRLANKLLATIDDIRKGYEQLAVSNNGAGPRDETHAPNTRTKAEIPWEVVEAFAILGLTPTNDLDAVKNAYRYLRGIHHPDRGGPAASADRFRRVQEAWERIQSWQQARDVDR